MRSSDRAIELVLLGLSEAHRRRVIERYDKLRPYLEEHVPLKRVAAEAGLPLRTAQRWVNRYRRFGLIGLNRAPRADRGKHRRLPDELRRLAEDLATRNPPLRPAAIYREICRAAEAGGQAAPSYHTIYNVIRGLHTLRGVLKRGASGAVRARLARRARDGLERRATTAEPGGVLPE